MLSVISLFAILATGLAITVYDCPAGLTRDHYLQAEGNFCYRFIVHRRLGYADAEAECAKNGGLLARPKTKKMNEYLSNTLSGEYDVTERVWIGLDDRETEDEFRWSDGQLLTEKYSAWADGNGPRSFISQKHFEDCVTLDPTEGKWHDYHCENVLWFNYKKQFVCEYKATPKPTCPPFACGLDCNMDGFKTHPVSGCAVCKCDN